MRCHMAHIDVVFADETELPLEIRDGRICCPGVGDDTACLASLLLVAKYIAEHKNTPQWKELRGEHAPGLLLVCNSGEEGLGNLKGVKNICSRYGSRMESFCTFDGSLESMVDRAVGSHRYQVTVRTQGGHSFSNFGRDNAIEKLGRDHREAVSDRCSGARKDYLQCRHDLRRDLGQYHCPGGPYAL